MNTPDPTLVAAIEDIFADLDETGLDVAPVVIVSDGDDSFHLILDDQFREFIDVAFTMAHTLILSGHALAERLFATEDSGQIFATKSALEDLAAGQEIINCSYVSRADLASLVKSVLLTRRLAQALIQRVDNEEIRDYAETSILASSVFESAIVDAVK